MKVAIASVCVYIYYIYIYIYIYMLELNEGKMNNWNKFMKLAIGSVTSYMGKGYKINNWCDIKEIELWLLEEPRMKGEAR